MTASSENAAGEELVAVPRSLLGAACAAIRGKRDAPNTLSQLNRYAVHGHPLAKPASSPAVGDVREAARGVMAAWEMHPGTLDTPRRLAKWFDENMSPAIIALRAALSQSTSAGRDRHDPV